MAALRRGCTLGPPRRTPTKKNDRRFVAPASRWRFCAEQPRRNSPAGCRRYENRPPGPNAYWMDASRQGCAPGVAVLRPYETETIGSGEPSMFAGHDISCPYETVACGGSGAVLLCAAGM